MDEKLVEFRSKAKAARKGKGARTPPMLFARGLWPSRESCGPWGGVRARTFLRLPLLSPSGYQDPAFARSPLISNWLGFSTSPEAAATSSITLSSLLAADCIALEVSGQGSARHPSTVRTYASPAFPIRSASILR